MTVILIMLSAKLKTSSSFRSLSKIFVEFNLYLNIGCSNPSYSATMLWVKKIGYSQLQCPKEKAEDWIIIADESIGIGQEKVLVILGIRRSKIDFTRPLRLQDMEPIIVKSKERWTGEDIANEIEVAKEKLGTIIYAVTDAGSSLKCGLNKVGVAHVYDITHAMAIFLERLYKNDDDFKDFASKAGQMRFKLCCSKTAHLIPPNQRSKARFLNIDTITKWGVDVLRVLEHNKLSKEERLQLLWVKQKEAFINEMDTVISLVEKISIILKNQGLCKKTKSKCCALLKQCKTGKLKLFKQYILTYLKQNAKQISKRAEKILCCSDIIETIFGKYKNELSKNPMSGITDLVLIIPAFTSSLKQEVVRAAIENSTLNDIKEWKKENLCNSLLSKRKAVFNK